MRLFIIMKCLLLLLLTSCIPLNIPKSADSSETQTDLYSSSDLKKKMEEMQISPFYFRDLVDGLSDEIEDTDKEIIVVDTRELWPVVFPNKTPDAEVSLVEVLQNESRNILLEKGIEFLIILDKYTETEQGENWAFWPAATLEEQTSCSWLLVEINNFSEIQTFLTKSEGKGHAGWIPAYFLLFFITSTDPNTEQKAISTLAEDAVNEMRKIKPSGLIKISVIAGAF